MISAPEPYYNRIFAFERESGPNSPPLPRTARRKRAKTRGSAVGAPNAAGVTPAAEPGR
ncbi:hypothetical protein SAMN04487819_103319 [Actinopolyspora alba]|uniref:Uncharacterized protein n=1 Tax=Actinopolyspora alba TaxID=673379 RepID=A0A1I1VF62_9ACTN|nr:hypothetical protein SAMN04487819_103319 [Actinopolyspora alba]